MVRRSSKDVTTTSQDDNVTITPQDEEIVTTNAQDENSSTNSSTTADTVTNSNDDIPLSISDDVRLTDIGSKTCEYIGVVRSTEGPRVAHNGKRWFKGSIEFGDKLMVKFICWNEAIELHQTKIILNHVVHFENALCNKLHPDYIENSPVPFEFVFGEYTTVTDYGKFSGQSSSINGPSYETMHLIDIMNRDVQYVRLNDCYIKTAPTTSTDQRSNSVTTFCSITDGALKFDVRFGANVDTKLLQKGVPITLQGKLITRGSNSYILVEGKDGICVREGNALSIRVLIEATQTPKRRATSPLNFDNKRKKK